MWHAFTFETTTFHVHIQENVIQRGIMHKFIFPFVIMKFESNGLQSQTSCVYTRLEDKYVSKGLNELHLHYPYFSSYSCYT